MIYNEVRIVDKWELRHTNVRVHEIFGRGTVLCRIIYGHVKHRCTAFDFSTRFHFNNLKTTVVGTFLFLFFFFFFSFLFCCWNFCHFICTYVCIKTQKTKEKIHFWISSKGTCCLFTLLFVIQIFGVFIIYQL